MATQKTPLRRSIVSMLPKDALQSYGKKAEPAAASKKKRSMPIFMDGTFSRCDPPAAPTKKKGGKAYPANQGKTAKKGKR